MTGGVTPSPLKVMLDAFNKEHDNWRLPNPENHQCSKWCREACMRSAFIALEEYMISDRKAAKYFQRLAEQARGRASMYQRQARATSDLVSKTNLEALADAELELAAQIDKKVQELE